jgi:hypothetical protein
VHRRLGKTDNDWRFAFIWSGFAHSPSILCRDRF